MENGWEVKRWTMKSLTKLEKSWVMYDWANSSYATIMMAAIFPVYFVTVLKDVGQDGDKWWGWATAAATLICAILAPVLGAVADYKGMKKKLLVAFLGLGLTFTFFNAVVDNWQLMLVGYILSYIGFMLGNLFYDSFLTDVTTPDRMDKVSSWGFGMGYIGGSTIPFIISIALIMLKNKLGISSSTAVKISLLLVVVWWGLFSIPILKNVKQKYYSELPSSKLILNTLKSIKMTIISILSSKGILLFMLAYFFYIDGVNTVINMATAYGKTLDLDSTGMILALMVTQLVAFPCAILFGKISKKIGTINIILSAICVYFAICIIGFVMGFGIEEKFLTIDQALIIFWILAVMVGTCQGGIQALSRSYFAKLVPPEKSNEYFGFFDIFGKFAAIIGPFLYATVKAVTGRSSFSILSIILLFLVGGIIMFYGRKKMHNAEIAQSNH
jgi:UMF1 family MFS transporter